MVEADGGSRGNPGVAGYGALVRDADTARVLLERAAPLGRASNNVAEYSGLIAGLEAAARVDDAADVEVRMDSKLVVEQMSGRWKIKHEDMRRLAAQAADLATERQAAGGSVTYTWVPRNRNAAADALSNVGMDGETVDRRLDADESDADEPDADEPDAEEPDAEPEEPGAGEALVEPEAAAGEPRGSEPLDAPPTGATSTAPADLSRPVRVVLVRHGETPNTRTGVLDGRGGPDAPLTPEGRAQSLAAGRGIRAFLGDCPVRVVTSSLARARQSGAVLGSVLGVEPEADAAFDEQHFGDWEGQASAALCARDAESYLRLREGDEHARPGGESFRDVRERVLAGYGRLVAQARHDGRVVVIVSHRTALLALLSEVLRMAPGGQWSLALAPGSLTSVRVWGDGGTSVEFVNDTAHLR